jgi:hypothetical protein
MEVLALVFAAGFAISFIITILGVLRHREREHVRKERIWETERKALLDRIMYLTGRPWEPAPYEVEDVPQPVLVDVSYHPEDLPLE